MSTDLSELMSYAAQLPIVGVIVWVVFKFINVMKEEREGFTQTLEEERTAFLGELKDERGHRATSTEKLDVTMVGFTKSVTDLGHAVTELRADVKQNHG